MCPFRYEGLFSQRTPAPVRRAPTHARYDFAVAYPDPDLLPLDDLAQAMAQALQAEGRSLALYPPAMGHEGLRDLIVEKLAEDRGIRTDRDHVLLTSGSMQGLNLIFEALLDPGDIVLTEDFFYLGTLRSLRRFGARVIGIPCDQQGMRMDALEETLATLKRFGLRPKLLYTIPTFQNPQGSELPVERRRRLIELAHAYGFPILEDDCYVDLRIEGDNIPAIASLPGADGAVLYASSFSKIVAPGVRLGWVVAPTEVMERLTTIKLDAGTNHLAAMVVYRYLREHRKPHVQELIDGLRRKRDAMLSALGEAFGPRAQWSRPRGGMYIWVRLREGADTAAVQEKALQAGVSYYNGSLFSPEGKGKNCLRLCFAYPKLEDIYEGVRVLGRFFEREGLL
ncbi:MAG: PLP-dependent aminotransferase family protein [Dehalococcoidia bacterium]|nr:PLP-dependent aminotransferase family protein [Dehalococcoidia bacterium]MDW8120672.1 PLP-dependent aminotransferase family protein [Chloroflexota bacterium]